MSPVPCPLRYIGSALAAALAVTCLANTAAADEAKTVRFAQQFGVHYLPLHVMVGHELVQKHARAMGIPDADVKLVKLSGGTAVNDGLLSGSIDFAGGGTGPLLKLWSKTRERAEVRGIGAIVSLPMLLNTNDPAIKDLKDFTTAHRIGLPAVKVSIQAVVLQMAAKKLYGEPSRFDGLTVSMRHPDAMAALLSGKSHIVAHFAVPPFSYQELEKPGVHTIVSSYDIVGGQHMQLALYNTRKWRDENPKLFKAVYAALDEAMEIINADKRAAAELYVRVENSKLPVDFVHKIISKPEIVFTTTPQRTMQFANFLHEIGSLDPAPKSWKDLFWEPVHTKPGS